MKAFKKILSVITYVLLMILGLFFLVGFFLLGTLIGMIGKELIDITISNINFLLQQANEFITNDDVNKLVQILNMIPGVQVSLVYVAENLSIQIDSIPNWSMWIIASPFYIFSLLGFSIILLTQRTTVSRSKINKIKVMLKDLMGENFEKMSIDKLRSFLQEKNISYKQKHSKKKLLKIIDKKVF